MNPQDIAEWSLVVILACGAALTCFGTFRMAWVTIRDWRY